MTPKGAQIREAVFDDYPQIAAVLTRNGLQPKIRENWERFWLGNPLYPKLNHWPIGWVAENQQREIVGYMGNIPLRYSFGGKELTAATVYGLCMDVPYRSSGGFLMRRFIKQKAVDFLLVTSANASSARLNEAFGRPRVPAGDWSRSSYWITDYRGFLASLCAKRGWPKSLCYPFASALSWLGKLVNDRGRTDRSSVAVHRSSFDERFDGFWEKLKTAYPRRLLTSRSSEDLRWHFGDALQQGRAWVATMDGASGIEAYAVFLRQDNPALGLKRIGLIDFQALNHDNGLLLPALLWALRRCQEEGIHMLESIGFRADKQSVIDSLLPRHRQFSFWSYFYASNSKGLGQELLDPNVWDPSQYDGDSSL